jgi:hypothetical protein
LVEECYVRGVKSVDESVNEMDRVRSSRMHAMPWNATLPDAIILYT